MGQSTVFSQVIKLIPRSEFESYVAKFDGDRGTRTIDCWTWFGSLLFGQLTGHDSIRAIERVFAHQDGEAKRNDDKFAYVAAWEFKGAGAKPALHQEPLTYENVHLAVRNYK